jgi:hypothetical protein
LVPRFPTGLCLSQTIRTRVHDTSATIFPSIVQHCENKKTSMLFRINSLLCPQLKISQKLRQWYGEIESAQNPPHSLFNRNEHVGQVHRYISRSEIQDNFGDPLILVSVSSTIAVCYFADFTGRSMHTARSLMDPMSTYDIEADGIPTLLT